jgi:polyamine oxidase
VRWLHCSGKLIPSGIAADSYKKAVDSAIQKLRNEEEDEANDDDANNNNNINDGNKVTKPPS